MSDGSPNHDSESSPRPLIVSSVPANSKAIESPTQSVTWPLLIYLTLAVCGCGADLWTKSAVFEWRGNPSPSNEWWVVEGFCGIETSLNNGALFGLGQGFQSFFAVMSIGAFGGILYWLVGLKAAHDRWLVVCLGMITGGVFGNLYDRMGWGKLPGTPPDYQHAVRDWILFRFGSFTWPNFNVADTLLVCGAGMLVLHSFFTDDSSE